MKIKKISIHVILGLVTLSTLIPFLWMIATSVKPAESVFEDPPRWIPRERKSMAMVDGEDRQVRPLRRMDDGTIRTKVLAVRSDNGDLLKAGRIVNLPESDIRNSERVNIRIGNYPEAWDAYPFVSFGRAYLNSLGVSLIVTLGQVITCVLAAYAFARSSPRLHNWIVSHAHFGPLITNWQQQGAIARRTKLIATAVLVATPFITWAMGAPRWALVAQIIVLVGVGIFILSRPDPTPPSLDEP